MLAALEEKVVDANSAISCGVQLFFPCCLLSSDRILTT
jgi:hypothetical protein